MPLWYTIICCCDCSRKYVLYIVGVMMLPWLPNCLWSTWYTIMVPIDDPKCYSGNYIDMATIIRYRSMIYAVWLPLPTPFDSPILIPFIKYSDDYRWCRTCYIPRFPISPSTYAVRCDLNAFATDIWYKLLMPFVMPLQYVAILVTDVTQYHTSDDLCSYDRVFVGRTVWYDVLYSDSTMTNDSSRC